MPITNRHTAKYQNGLLAKIFNNFLQTKSEMTKVTTVVVMVTNQVEVFCGKIFSGQGINIRDGMQWH